MGLRLRKYSDVRRSDFDAVVVGCGFAGAVVARELAERAGMRVLILEKRNHIAGNMYDKVDDTGILVHCYGPHIFHTNDTRVYQYIRRFCDWHAYQHEVLADWYGVYMPVPFNINSLEIAFGVEKAAYFAQKLTEAFGAETKVSITALRQQDDPELTELADFVYKNVFLFYTQKQWGLTPEEIDSSVTARVPVHLSRDNRYFQDKYQGLPRGGYTALFEAMLDHERITICLETEAESVFDLEFEDAQENAPLAAIYLKDEPFEGPLVYTGTLDELFLSRFGRLPYRSIDFEYESSEMEYVFPRGTINYTVTEDYTRVTEFKHLTGQRCANSTVMREYSHPYDNPQKQTPYYAIITQENIAHYQRYLDLTVRLSNFYILGRLAEYRYYNMDGIIAQALELADALVNSSKHTNNQV